MVIYSSKQKTNPKMTRPPYPITWSDRIREGNWETALLFWTVSVIVLFLDSHFDGLVLNYITAHYIPIDYSRLIESALIIIALINLFTYFVLVVIKENLPVPNFYKQTKRVELSTSRNSSFLSNQSFNDSFSPYRPPVGDVFDPGLRKMSSTSQPSPKKLELSGTPNAILTRTQFYSIPKLNSSTASDIFTEDQLPNMNDGSVQFTVKSSSGDKLAKVPYFVDDEDWDQSMPKDTSRVDDLFDISHNSRDLFDAAELSGVYRSSSKSRDDPFELFRGDRGRYAFDFGSSGAPKLADISSFKSPRLVNVVRNPFWTGLGSNKSTISIEELFHEYRISPQNISQIEEKVRRYIGTRVIQPLVRTIHETNTIISNFTNVRLGSNSIDEIKELISRTSSFMPDVAPIIHYLSVCPQDQKHLMKKLEKWAKSDIMYGFSSTLQADPAPSFTTERTLNSPSRVSLPTEGELVFKLFCAYMDCQISPFPITRPYEHDKPFTHAYSISGSALGKKVPASSYFVELDDSSPLMGFRFHTKYPIPVVTMKTTAAITIIIALLAHTHSFNGGSFNGLELEKIDLGPELLTDSLGY